jgi:uncharacterized protein YjbI with pentapeptide repeats
MIASGEYYAGQTFSKETHDGLCIQGSEFHDCRFETSSFVESTFEKSRFMDCRFLDCDLSLVRVSGSIFTHSTFARCKIIGVDWTQANWSGSVLEKPIGFVSCNISHSTFIGLKMERLILRDCKALDVDFREAQLRQADLSGAVLTGSLFQGTDMTEADLRGAREYSIDVTQNEIIGAKFSLPEAMALLFSLDIDLEGASRGHGIINAQL